MNKKSSHPFSHYDSEILLEEEEGTFFETMVPRTMEHTPLLPEQDEVLPQKSLSDDSDGRDPVSENASMSLASLSLRRFGRTVESHSIFSCQRHSSWK
jgi:hypothetical protein